MNYLDDDCGCSGNSGHGPGDKYDRPVGPKGALLAWWIIIGVVGGIGYLLGIGH